MVDETGQVALKGCIYHHIATDFTHVEIHLTLFLHHPEAPLASFIINNCTSTSPSDYLTS